MQFTRKTAVEKILDGVDIRKVLMEDIKSDFKDQDDLYYTRVFRDVLDTDSRDYYSVYVDTKDLLDKKNNYFEYK